MKIKRVLLALLAVSSCQAFAQQRQESCEVMRKVNGVLTGVQVLCSELKRPTTPDQEAALQRQRDEQTTKRRKCGKDFEALRIGMKLERYEECTEAVDYITETVSKSGVVETYRGTFWLIQVQHGKIISYTRL